VFAADPAYAAEFFYNKAVSQWNEPSYEGFILNAGAAKTERSELAGRVYREGTLNSLILMEQDLIHLLTYMGGATALLLLRKKKDIRLIIPAIIVLGGFFFHTVWEAKSQYIMQYGYMALLMAAPGLVFLSEYTQKLLSKLFIYLKTKFDHKDDLNEGV
jgi:hypothetical protein